MANDAGRSVPDGLSQAEPEVSALRASIPSAIRAPDLSELAALLAHAISVHREPQMIAEEVALWLSSDVPCFFDTEEDCNNG